MIKSTAVRNLVAIALCMGTWGCSGEDSEVGNDPPATFESTYDGIQRLIFEGQGCTEGACHGSAGAGELILTADVSYEQLVEAPSAGSNFLRVEPGERTRSYLYLKLLAALDPDATEISGSAMPTGRAPIPEQLLEALRLWIYVGAPASGTVPGTAELLGVELPAPRPISISPLPVPPVNEGIQLELPSWTIPAGSEREVCFASYFDLRDQVPAEFKDESGDFVFINIEHLRQDPQSHHLIINRSRVDSSRINDPAFGEWRCAGGEENGQSCEPLDLDSCGTGHCVTEPVDTFGCIGYGPFPEGGGRPSYPIGGAQKPQNYDELPEGVFYVLPLHGILLWNSHAFNLTDEDHMMNGRINYLFAREQTHRARSLFQLGAANIFKPATPAFQREEVCSELTLERNAHLFKLSSHTHQRGEYFSVTHPDGSLLYENFIFSDPTFEIFSPPLVFDSEDPAERSLRYCAVYNNGVGAEGEPDIETVTRYSRMPDSVQIPGVPGLCTPTACVAGQIGANCNGADDNATCDSAPGAGDGWCDACAITGGESTENEMFMLLGAYYVP